MTKKILAYKDYVAGWLDGGLIPTPDAFQETNPGTRTGFVYKLSEAAAACVYDVQPASTSASASVCA